MRKVDLHVHTVSNPFSDGKFDFNLEVLKKYVEKMNIECIAITNHNIFDKEQFREIENKLDILVDSAGTGSWHIGEAPCENLISTT